MNLFTDHNYGCYADDGFGNLVRLTIEQVFVVLSYYIGAVDHTEWYE